MTYKFDADLVKQKYRKQWIDKQLKLQQRLTISDSHLKFQIPNNISIHYKQNHFGSVTISKTKNTNKKLVTKKLSHKNISIPNLKYIAGIDISVTYPGAYDYDKASVAIVVYEYPSMKCIHKELEIVTLQFPYISGFLAFREVFPMKRIIQKLCRTHPSIKPQVILVDGNGIMHYRRMGLASHLSLLVNIPCIGIAKKCLNVDGINVEWMTNIANRNLREIGDFYLLPLFLNRRGHSEMDDSKCDDVHICAALKTHAQEMAVYVSPGNGLSLETSLKIAVLCIDRRGRYRLPLPTNFADYISRKHIREYERMHFDPNFNENKEQMMDVLKNVKNKGGGRKRKRKVKRNENILEVNEGKSVNFKNRNVNKGKVNCVVSGNKKLKKKKANISGDGWSKVRKR